MKFMHTKYCTVVSWTPAGLKERQAKYFRFNHAAFLKMLGVTPADALVAVINAKNTYQYEQLLKAGFIDVTTNRKAAHGCLVFKCSRYSRWAGRFIEKTYQIYSSGLIRKIDCLSPTRLKSPLPLHSEDGIVAVTANLINGMHELASKRLSNA